MELPNQGRNYTPVNIGNLQNTSPSSVVFPQKPEKKKSPVLLALLILPFVIILLGGMYILHATSSQTKSNTTSLNQKITPQPTSIQIPLEDWKLFVSSDKAYQFKYPYPIYQQNPLIGVTTGGLALLGNITAGLNLSIYEDDYIQSCLKQKSCQITKTESKKINGVAMKKISATEILLKPSNIPTQEQEGMAALPWGKSKQIVVYTITNSKTKKVYSALLAHNLPEADGTTLPIPSEEIATFDQILSTFTFL